MGKKLFVGNLSFNATEEKLKQEFSQSGTVVSVNIIEDKMSGRPRGFGFVEMATDEEAKKAIEQCNGKEFEGRALTVNEARDRVDRNRSGGNRGRNDFGGRRRSNW